jgi:heptosyltransferase-2
VRTDAIGDVVLSLPVVTALRRSYPGATIAMLVHPRVQEIVEDHPDLDRIIIDTDDRHGIRDFFRMMRILKKARFDASVLLHPTFRLAIILFCSRIPIRIGTGYRFYSFLFNRRMWEHRKNSMRHEAEYNLSLIKCLGVQEGPVIFRYPVLDSAVSQVSHRLSGMGIDPRRPMIVLHPSSRGSALDWPLSSFTRLAHLLTDTFNACIVITGSKGDEWMAHEIIHGNSANIWSLAGQLTLKELAALLKRADLIVANSTGPLHIGAAIGIPAIGLFPPFTAASVRRWGPFGQLEDSLTPLVPECRRCTDRKCSVWNCMERISVEDVWEKCRKKLKERGYSLVTES